MPDIHYLRVTLLSPFNYGHLPVQGGVATIPDILSDRALSFALCAAAGMMSSLCLLPEKNYRGHIAAMPWRTSLFVSENGRLLPPLARRSDLGIEGGYQESVRRAAGSGNFKEYFTIQEVRPGTVYHGAVFGADPFEIVDNSRFVVRIGSNRTGMALVERDPAPKNNVRLNSATAALFGRDLPVDRYYLHELLATPPMQVAEAASEVATWN